MEHPLKTVVCQGGTNLDGIDEGIVGDNDVIPVTCHDYLDVGHVSPLRRTRASSRTQPLSLANRERGLRP